MAVANECEAFLSGTYQDKAPVTAQHGPPVVPV